MSTENETGKERDSTAAVGDGIQLSAMIDKILANPELIGMVASALGPIPKGNSAKSETAPVSEQSDESESVTADANATENAVDAAEKLPELVAAIAPVLSSLKGGSSSHLTPKGDRRSCLLLALKPYLCHERCEAIDYMIKLGRLSEIFRALG